jgi:gamma-butyrobetaine dioxygenase
MTLEALQGQEPGLGTPSWSLTEDALVLSWPDGRTARYNVFWLRENGLAAFHPDTEERMVDLLSAPDDLRARDVAIDGDRLCVTWSDDAASSEFDLAWLWRHRPGARAADPAAVEPWLWQRIGEPFHRQDAETLQSSDLALRDWLAALVEHGVAFVDGLGAESAAGLAIAARIGAIQETNFGRTFQVVSVPKPNSQAYTAFALALHTDLPNHEQPPGYQFLHCIHNEAAGGGSVLVDGFALAHDLQRDDPDAFHLLHETPIPFRFHDTRTDIRGWHPVIGLDAAGQPVEIRWSPAVAAPLDLTAEAMAPYYRAYRAFMRLVQSPRYQATFRLRPGEMMAFDNRRVLHGREAFDPNTGRRHLHGFYISRDEVRSRLRVLSREQTQI